ncbi:MAG: site-specific integrase [Actinomycetota bacterium]|nr:site-specific integrase [Actinomycetota bacterium]
MTSLAPTLQAFFTDRLIRQRGASPNTVAAYRDTFRLLLGHIADTTAKTPARLDMTDLDSDTIAAFLQYLETERHNSVRTRNARLSAIHAFFEYASLRHPEHADLIQRVLALPDKRYHSALVSYLTRPELDVVLSAPDRTTWTGQRDHAIILLAAQSGLRVSELTGLRIEDVVFGPGAHVRCTGKGRRERCTPLTKQTAATLQTWLRTERGRPQDPLFPSRGTNRQLTRGAIWRVVTKHASAGAKHCPSLADKHPTPHTLRHTCAMNLLHSGVDLATIALWLGHSSLQSTNAYLHADMALKERALARTAPSKPASKRYVPTDTLLDFLRQL